MHGSVWKHFFDLHGGGDEVALFTPSDIAFLQLAVRESSCEHATSKKE